jgi:hypothetical protein
MSLAFAGDGKALDKMLAAAPAEDGEQTVFAAGEQDEWEADMRAAWGPPDEDASL